MNKNKGIFNIIIALCLFIGLLMIYGTGESLDGTKETYVKLSYISIILAGYIIISMLFSGIKWHSLPLLYMLFFYIFIFGQVMCKYVFNFVDSELFDMSVCTSDFYLQKAILLGLYFYIAMYIAINIFYLINNKKCCYSDNQEDIQEMKIIKKVATIIMCISLPAAFIELVSNMKLALEGGYIAVYSNVTYGIDSIVTKLVPFFYVSVLLMIYANKSDKKKAMKWLIFIIIYSLITMFLGARGKPILQVVCAILLWNYIFKIPKKIIILGLISIIPLATTMAMLRVFRDYALTSWFNEFGNIFIEALKSQPILKVINEMGTAIYPTAATLDVVPEEINFKYGSTFIYALIAIIPNLSTTGASIAKYAANVNIEIGKYLGIAFGGAIIQEFYANFNWWGAIVAAMIFIYVFCCIESKSLNSKNKIVMPLYLAFMPSMLWTIRNNSAPLIKEYVWYILTTYILYLIIKKRSYNENKHNNTSV